jgi:type IV pilus assembly protein PilM
MNPVENKSFFKRFFPVPKILSTPTVGVDISDNSIRFLKFNATSGNATLEKFGVYSIPEGVISKGEIKNTKALSDVLRKFKEDHKINFVRASLPEEKVYLFETQIPDDVPDKDIRNIVEFKLEDHVPISPKNAVFDYSVIPNHDSHKGHTDIIVAVYPKQIVEQYTSAFEDAGFTVLSFETEAQAIARAIIKEKDDGTYMVVDFGKTKTGISIVRSGILSFTSTIEIEQKSMTEAMMKHLSVSEGEVSRVKDEQGLIKTRGNKELFSVLMKVAESLEYNIDKHYKYWKSKVNEKGDRVKPIEKIILCGGNSNLAGLPEYLSSSLKIPVERADVWINAPEFGDSVPEISKTESLSYAASVGLALRDTN